MTHSFSNHVCTNSWTTLRAMSAGILDSSHCLAFAWQHQHGAGQTSLNHFQMHGNEQQQGKADHMPTSQCPCPLAPHETNIESMQKLNQGKRIHIVHVARGNTCGSQWPVFSFPSVHCQLCLQQVSNLKSRKLPLSMVILIKSCSRSAQQAHRRYHFVYASVADRQREAVSNLLASVQCHYAHPTFHICLLYVRCSRWAFASFIHVTSEAHRHGGQARLLQLSG